MHKAAARFNRKSGSKAGFAGLAAGLIPGANPGQFELKKLQRQIDREAETDDSSDIGERQPSHRGHMLGGKQAQNNEEHGNDFGEAQGHGLAFGKPHG